jgi:hypothetical protein
MLMGAWLFAAAPLTKEEQLIRDELREQECYSPRVAMRDGFGAIKAACRNWFRNPSVPKIFTIEGTARDFCRYNQSNFPQQSI